MAASNRKYVPFASYEEETMGKTCMPSCQLTGNVGDNTEAG
jgi:hypothetical protein